MHFEPSTNYWQISPFLFRVGSGTEMLPPATELSIFSMFLWECCL